MNDSDYKKYSLEKLEEWMHDSLSTSKASPQEIYDVIVGVVKENYYIYKQQASQAYELLALLNGNGGWKIEDALKEREYYEGWDKSTKSNLICDKDDPSPECKGAWDDFWEECYYPHPDQPVYTEEELNAMCEKAASDQEKEKCREYNLREAEYYDKRAELDTMVKADGYSVNGLSHSEYYYDYTRNDPNRENPFTSLGLQNMNEDKVKTWRLPVEVDGASGEYFVCLPDDLQDASGIHEGDNVEWVDNKDGTYTMRKVTKPLAMDEC